jgi:CheY-like chemotaxis protein
VRPKQFGIPHSVAHVSAPGPSPHVVFSRNESSRSTKKPGQPARILIVEDDYLVAMQIEAALTEAGFEIAGVASTAEEALELAAERSPAVVVMDVRLGGRRDGIDTALELFGRHGIRCVFATAHYDAKVRARAAGGSVGLGSQALRHAYAGGAVDRAFREMQKDES